MSGQEYFEQVATRAQLTPKEKFILEKSFGVYEDRLPYREIGERMSDIGCQPISKQAVEQNRTRLESKLGADVWKMLEKFFPEPISETTIKKAISKVRVSILNYLRAADENTNVQYAHVHRLLGLEIPPHRVATAETMTELESCYAYMQDYNARNMGKYRYCTMCRTIKVASGEESQFYEVRNTSKNDGSTTKYQICKPCNTKRCVRFAKTGDGSLRAEDEALVGV
jgi:hypothetical protein